MRVYLDNCCYNRPFDPQTDLTMIPDNELRTECFQLLVDRFGHLDTERFIVMMSRSPMDYTTWHQRHFNNGESVRELGEKIKSFARTRKATVSAVNFSLAY